MEAIVRFSNILLLSVFWYSVTLNFNAEDVYTFVLITSISSILTAVVVSPLNQIMYRYLIKLRNPNTHLLLNYLLIITGSVFLCVILQTWTNDILGDISIYTMILFMISVNIHINTCSVLIIKKKYKNYVIRILLWYFLLGTVFFNIAAEQNHDYINFLLMFGHASASMYLVLDKKKKVNFRGLQYYLRYLSYGIPFLIVGFATLPLSGLDRVILSQKMDEHQLVKYFFIYQFLIAPGIEIGNSVASWMVNKIRRIDTGAEKIQKFNKYVNDAKWVVLLLTLLALPYFLIVFGHHHIGSSILITEPYLIMICLCCAGLAFLSLSFGSILTARGLMRKRILHKALIPWTYLCLISFFGQNVTEVIVIYLLVLAVDLVWTFIELIIFKDRVRLLD